MRGYRLGRCFCSTADAPSTLFARSRRAWTEAEDAKLRVLVHNRTSEMPVKWGEIAEELGTGRDARAARQRWEHTLSPGRACGPWTVRELRALNELKKVHGRDWAAIAAGLPTPRTTRQVRERVLEGGRSGRPWNPHEDKALIDAVEELGRRWTLVAKKVQGRTDNQCMERWSLSLDPRLRFGRWQADEDERLRQACIEERPEEDGDWSAVSAKVVTRNRKQCAGRWRRLCRSARNERRLQF